MANEAFPTLKQHWLGVGVDLDVAIDISLKLKKKVSTVLTMIVAS